MLTIVFLLSLLVSRQSRDTPMRCHPMIEQMSKAQPIVHVETFDNQKDSMLVNHVTIVSSAMTVNRIQFWAANEPTSDGSELDVFVGVDKEDEKRLRLRVRVFVCRDGKFHSILHRPVNVLSTTPTRQVNAFDSHIDENHHLVIGDVLMIQREYMMEPFPNIVKVGCVLSH